MKERVHKSSGYVFKDLGVPDPNNEFTKTKLAHEINTIIKTIWRGPLAVSTGFICSQRSSSLLRPSFF